MSLLKKIRKIIKGAEASRQNFAGNINYDHNFIFIHIPKNAGTSIYKALGFANSTHAQAKQYKKALNTSYDSFFSFCFVRNPFERFISTYNYARLKESYYHSAVDPGRATYGKHLDYEVLKNASLENATDLLLEGKLVHDNTWNHWRPQTEWILDDNGKMIVDFIGRVENIQTEFANICSKLQLPFNNNLQALNVSDVNKKDYKELVSHEMREKLEYYYRTDLDILGYSFDKQ